MFTVIFMKYQNFCIYLGHKKLLFSLFARNKWTEMRKYSIPIVHMNRNFSAPILQNMYSVMRFIIF